jgi:hypothetical protein
VLGTARTLLGAEPLDVFVAAGHGRSYGRWSRVLARGLPSILDCGLWSAAGAVNARATRALVTDVGNDIAYGAAPAELAGWVETCLDRLGAFQADVVLTLLPTASLARLRKWQYHVFKSVLFPGRRLPFAVLHQRVAEVNARLAEAAGRRGVTVVEPDAAWYGPDAIHVRRDRQLAAARAMLSAWGGGRLAGPPPVPEVGRVACRGLSPEWQTICGLPRRRRQPAAVLADGSRISLF